MQVLRIVAISSTSVNLVCTKPDLSKLIHIRRRKKNKSDIRLRVAFQPKQEGSEEALSTAFWGITLAVPGYNSSMQIALKGIGVVAHTSVVLAS